MYELLKAQKIHGFGLQYWRSTIRGLVCAHPEYVDLQSWTGTETADIVIDDDVHCDLPTIFYQCGYRHPRFAFERIDSSMSWDRSLHSQLKRKVYIEVKTTTEGCEETFYMSNAQYQRVSL